MNLACPLSFPFFPFPIFFRDRARNSEEKYHLPFFFFPFFLSFPFPLPPLSCPDGSLLRTSITPPDDRRREFEHSPFSPFLLFSFFPPFLFSSLRCRCGCSAGRHRRHHSDDSLSFFFSFFPSLFLFSRPDRNTKTRPHCNYTVVGINARCLFPPFSPPHLFFLGGVLLTPPGPHPARKRFLKLQEISFFLFFFFLPFSLSISAHATDESSPR